MRRDTRTRYLIWLASVSILAVGNVAVTAGEPSSAPRVVRLSRDDYRDRVRAVWSAQIAGTMMAWPFEHKVASVEWVDRLEVAKGNLPVDDYWYYEMVAVRGFEKYGAALHRPKGGDADPRRLTRGMRTGGIDSYHPRR
jgi:hypothetical protein